MRSNEVHALAAGDPLTFKRSDGILQRAQVDTVTENFVRVRYVGWIKGCYDVLHKNSPVWVDMVKK